MQARYYFRAYQTSAKVVYTTDRRWTSAVVRGKKKDGSFIVAPKVVATTDQLVVECNEAGEDYEIVFSTTLLTATDLAALRRPGQAASPSNDISRVTTGGEDPPPPPPPVDVDFGTIYQI